MQHEVIDGVRTLRFNGIKLAESSSQIAGRPRWVEFQLYRTLNNQYVVSRVGVSICFHASHCKIVKRNRLQAIDEAELPDNYIPCDMCRPSRISVEGVFPETSRYWAQVSELPQGVVSSVMKVDDDGNEYLTNVARRLLMDASEVDPDIREAFYFDNIG